jgi:hypothetical protein
VELHGSTISANSEPGRTVFRFTLAYAAKRTPPVEAADSRTVADVPKRQVPSLAYPMAERQP